MENQRQQLTPAQFPRRANTFSFSSISRHSRNK